MKYSGLDFQPVIIIGAARSGTNALRNLLTHMDDIGSWPCDEINAIWRHKNGHHLTDQFGAELATQHVVSFIRKEFEREWRRQGKPRILVEKTCANTLRIPFLRKVFPEAKYISIVRNGANVVPSAKKRWRGELEMPSVSYFSQKLRYVPLSDIPLFGWRFLQSRLSQLTGQSDRLTFWGPVVPGWKTSSELDCICAYQWASCVKVSTHDLMNVSEVEHLSLKYEQLTSEPLTQLKRILDFLQYDYTSQRYHKTMSEAAGLIRDREPSQELTMPSIGDDEYVQELFNEVMEEHHYEVPSK